MSIFHPDRHYCVSVSGTQNKKIRKIHFPLFDPEASHKCNRGLRAVPKDAGEQLCGGISAWVGDEYRTKPPLQHPPTRFSCLPEQCGIKQGEELWKHCLMTPMDLGMTSWVRLLGNCKEGKCSLAVSNVFLNLIGLMLLKILNQAVKSRSFGLKYLLLSAGGWSQLCNTKVGRHREDNCLSLSLLLDLQVSW